MGPALLRHYRLVSVVGGLVAGVLMWVVTGAQADAITVFLDILMAAAFGTGMFLTFRATLPREPKDGARPL